MIGENTVTKYSHSSVPLQMLIFFSYHYTPFFFFVNLCLYTYKGKDNMLSTIIAVDSFACLLRSVHSGQILLSGKAVGLGAHHSFPVLVY